MEPFTMFDGDCPYCGDVGGASSHPIQQRFEFGPRGGAGRMMRCCDCGAEFIWIPAVNTITDNEAFPRGEDGACRR